MPALFGQLVAVALLLGLLILPASAAQRVALVVGNSTYTHIPALKTPANDAADLAAALREIGFEVIERHDLDRASFQDALSEFSNKLANAELALFYYAGHGLQLGGSSYLVPVDANIRAVAEVRPQTLDLSTVVEKMQGDKRSSLIFVDTNRDNPFRESDASDRKMAPAMIPAGVLLSFATQPGGVALDGTGRNSPYTAALLKHIKTSDLEVGQMLSQVRRDVAAATGAKQIPWDTSTLVGDVYLAPAPGAK